MSYWIAYKLEYFFYTFKILNVHLPSSVTYTQTCIPWEIQYCMFNYSMNTDS